MMTKYPFSYTVATNVDDVVFSDYCAMLEKNVAGIRKEKTLIDVDGSETQIYHCNGKEIVVHNSCYIDAVYIDSQVDLLPFFDKPPILNNSTE